MLVFINKDTYKSFVVNNKACKVEFISNSAYHTLHKFVDYIGEIETLTLPSIVEVKQFRKLVERGALKDVPIESTREFVLNNYPEHFI